MKNIIFILIFLIPLMLKEANAANEISREGICGDRIAQPGPDPQ